MTSPNHGITGEIRAEVGPYVAKLAETLHKHAECLVIGSEMTSHAKTVPSSSQGRFARPDHDDLHVPWTE